jgi:DNA-binding response OmpR family regulator
MRIVIIAESAFLRTSLRVNLSPAGHRVVEVEPGSLLHILEVLRAHRPGLAIVDLDLAEYCCAETLVRAIREDPVLARTPLVALYSAESEAILSRVWHWGLIDCFLKPFHADAVVALLNARFVRTG